MKKPILILLPTLNRPQSLCDCISSFVINGSGLADIITLGGPGGITAVLNSVPMELIRQYEIVGSMGDDIRMRTKGWDLMVCDRLLDKIGMIHGRDGIQDSKLPTHPFISTPIIAALGFIQPAELKHFYGDNFYQELLGPLGLIQYVPELFTEHLHFTIGLSPKDSTYEAGYRHWDADGAAWEQYRQRQLPTMIARVRGLL